MLLASEQTYAGQGYCLAVGLIGGHKCESHLGAYLDKYLLVNGRWYDQKWAIGALTHLREEPPCQYLDLNLWTDAGRSMDPIAGIEAFDLIRYLRLHGMIAPPSPA